MTLEDINYIAQIIGTVAIIVSLVFVGMQIAQANTLARRAAEQKQIESVGALSRLSAENPYLAELLVKISAGGELTPAERVTMVSYMTFAERTWEALYEQYRAGLVDPEIWDGHRQMARTMSANPLHRAVWEQRKHWYSDRYRRFREADSDGPRSSNPGYQFGSEQAEGQRPTKRAPATVSPTETKSD